MTQVRISRQVPLEQLREPETDVREQRDADGITSLAASMGDPDVGQLQDILVHPVEPDDALEEESEDELHALLQDGHPMRIVDGETRRLAATQLGWATLSATIVPRPPENTTIAQLDANSERLDMSHYETAVALRKHKQETGCSVKELANKVGFSPSYMSQILNVLEAPEPIIDAWSNPQHPVETGHAKCLYYMLSGETVEEYAKAGALEEDAARERAMEDVLLMIDVQQRRDLPVTEFQKRAKRCQNESIRDLEDGRSQEEKQADGQSEAAQQQHTPHEPEPNNPCTVCSGDRPNDRRFALEVCHSCYGMLSEMEANGETMNLSESDREPPERELVERVEDGADFVRAVARGSTLTEEEAAAKFENALQAAAGQPADAADR